MSRPKKLNEETLLAALLESDIEDFSSDSEDHDPNWKFPTNDAYESTDKEDEDTDRIGNESDSEESQQFNNQSHKIWRRRPFNPIETTISSAPTDDIQPPVESPKQYFSKYFNDEFFDRIAEHSNRYYMKFTGQKLDATIGEMKNFFGIIMIMDCIRYPRMRMYWQNRTKLPMIAHTMTRERFFALRMALHIVDDIEVSEDAKISNVFWKVQPLIEVVRSACRNIPREQGACYSIDEQMIPFSDRNAISQFGLENVILATSEGLVLDFEINQGQITPIKDKGLGLGPALVLRLVETLPQGSKIFFDRYFTTIPLLQTLLQRGIYGTGTIPKNRVKNIHLTEEKKMKRAEMDEFCHIEDNIVVVQWKDQKTVILASSAFGCRPISNVLRWDKKEKKRIEVSIPSIVREYKKSMGGVEISNRLMDAYRSYSKATKWHFKVLQYFINLVCCNAWLQYRIACRLNKMSLKDSYDLLSFRLYLAEALISVDKNKNDELMDDSSDEECIQTNIKRYRRSDQPCTEKRLDGYGHWPSEDDLKSARCCRRAGCRSRTRTLCTKCNVYLCLSKKQNCFQKYHTQK